MDPSRVLPWVQVGQAIGITFLAGVGARIAWKQMNIAESKLQHDLYDRRYKIFQAALDMLSEVSREANISSQAVQRFVIGTSDARFLLNKEIVKYLTEIRDRAHKLSVVNQHMSVLPAGNKTTSLGEASRDHCVWLMQQIDELGSRFQPFLQLETSRSSTWSPILILWRRWWGRL